MANKRYFKAHIFGGRVFVAMWGAALFVPAISMAALSGTNSPASTNAPGYIYLNQVPYTGFGDFAGLFGFLILIGLWSLFAVMVLKNKAVKEIIRKFFRNVELEPSWRAAGTSGGTIFDVSGKQLLNMSMHPVSTPTIAGGIPKSNFGEGRAEPSFEIVPPHDERAFTLKSSNPSAAKNGSSHFAGNAVMSDVNAFLNYVASGDEVGALEYFRKVRVNGVTAENFASSVILELDEVYRAAREGVSGMRNPALSQILRSWSPARIESVIGAMFSVVEHNYTDPYLGAKVALMRIMRAG